MGTQPDVYVRALRARSRALCSLSFSLALYREKERRELCVRSWPRSHVFTSAHPRVSRGRRVTISRANIRRHAIREVSCKREQHNRANFPERYMKYLLMVIRNVSTYLLVGIGARRKYRYMTLADIRSVIFFSFCCNCFAAKWR